MIFSKARNRLLASILALGLVGAGQTVAGPMPDMAARYVEDLGQRASALIAEIPPEETEGRQAALRDLIRDGFNLELTSQFVLGKFWNRATPEQQVEFLELFTEYLLHSYARQIGSIQADTLNIVSSHRSGKADFLVETSVEGRNGPTSPVWRVRVVDGQYKIIDVSLNGVSLALTQRREFSSVVNRVGLEGLLKMLRIKVANQAKTVLWRPSRRDSHASLLAPILASPKVQVIQLQPITR